MSEISNPEAARAQAQTRARRFGHEHPVLATIGIAPAAAIGFVHTLLEGIADVSGARFLLPKKGETALGRTQGTLTGLVLGIYDWAQQGKPHTAGR
ncbi:MAG: hypothetical protein KGI73_02045 [Patescibacteria group bacterium]|nr:hypothetical protein [Patescibacteria group bacterium]